MLVLLLNTISVIAYVANRTVTLHLFNWHDIYFLLKYYKIDLIRSNTIIATTIFTTTYVTKSNILIIEKDNFLNLVWFEKHKL